MQIEQQVNQTTTNLGQSKFALANPLQIASPQGVQLNQKNKDQICDIFQKTINQNEMMIDCQNVQSIPGGIKVDLFMEIKLKMSLFMSHSQADNSSTRIRPSLSGTPNQSQVVQKGPSRQVTKDSIFHIFQHKRFRKDMVLASSPLLELIAVKEAIQSDLHAQGLEVDTLSEHDKADLLRSFLIECINNALCPNPNHKAPKNLSEMSQDMKNKWIQYLIMRKQYVEGLSRGQVETKVLETRDCWITGGTYARHLKTARERLANLIWQKEMQARKRLA